jgi:hypothetical protein
MRFRKCLGDLPQPVSRKLAPHKKHPEASACNVARAVLIGAKKRASAVHPLLHPGSLGSKGPDGEEILFTGDAVRDKVSLADFVTAYTRLNRGGRIKAGGQALYLGPDNSRLQQ